MIVLPGGMPGTLNEEASEQVQAAITYCAEQNRYLTAICAAPSILGHRGLLNGKHAVCYPGFESALTGAEVGTEGVVQDGNIITARGAGVAIDFGLALVAALCGAEKVQRFGRELYMPEQQTKKNNSASITARSAKNVRLRRNNSLTLPCRSGSVHLPAIGTATCCCSMQQPLQNRKPNGFYHRHYRMKRL